MKRIFGVLLMALVVTGIASATAVSCSSITNLGQLVSGGTYATSGCYLGNPGYMGDTWFSGFTYVASDASTASQTSINAVTTQINSLGVDLAQLTFNNSYSNATYTISFTATICSSSLVSAGDCVTASASGSSFTEVQSELFALGGYSATGTTSFAGNSGGTITQTQTASTTPAQINSYYSSPAPTSIAVTSVFGGTGYYETADQLAFYQGSASPEPSTMLLMGGALVGLGVIGRKRRNKKA